MMQLDSLSVSMGHTPLTFLQRLRNEATAWVALKLASSSAHLIPSLRSTPLGSALTLVIIHVETPSRQYHPPKEII